MNRLKRLYYNWRADVHLLSFPKCGRTWLRLMMSRVIRDQFNVGSGDSLQLHKFASRRLGIPSILASHDFQVVRGGIRRDELDVDKTRFGGKRVLLVIRDPRDVVVSFYYHKKLRERSYTGTLSEFIRKDFDGLRTIIDYYNIWARSRDIPSDLEFVMYESMREETVASLRQVVRYCGFQDVSDDVLENAAAEYEFNRMREKEAQGDIGHGHTKRPADRNDPNSFKARSGKVGGYRDELSVEDQAYVEQTIAERLDDFYRTYKAGEQR